MEEAKNRFFRSRSPAEIAESQYDDDGMGGGRPRRIIWWAGGIVVIIIAGAALFTWFFGRATIAISLQKSPWSYSGNFTADKSVAAPNAADGVIPAQVFSANKNATQLFPATGTSTALAKAQGTITIYNNYSAKPQQLVVKTRFVTPDGKLFRLTANVTVPGASVTSQGAITPSSVQATVVADQPGASYDVGPVQKLTIPGFQGTPEYNGFYGALSSGASGGDAGAEPIPTASDVANAKSKMQTILQGALADDIAASYPNNFKILDGATNVVVTKLTVNTTTDANGNFSVFGEASLQAVGFDEGALGNALLAIADPSTPSSTWKEIDLSYANVQADFTKGTVSFTLNASGTLEQAFDADGFKKSIEGDSIGSARTAIAGIPGLANGTLSVWPVWLWRIPTDPGKIAVTVD